METAKVIVNGKIQHNPGCLTSETKALSLNKISLKRDLTLPSLMLRSKDMFLFLEAVILMVKFLLTVRNIALKIMSGL